MQSTLVLNASYEPLSVVPVTRAISMLMSGKAVSLDDSNVVFRSTSFELNAPYVVRLNAMVHRSSRRKVAFSRRGVLVRDNFTCVYCGKRGDTIDHVLPQSKGGPTSYENCVAACRKCNSKKDDLLLSEIGWSLPQKPSAPSWYMMALFKAPAASPQRESWAQHIAYYDPKVALMIA